MEPTVGPLSAKCPKQRSQHKFDLTLPSKIQNQNMIKKNKNPYFSIPSPIPIPPPIQSHFSDVILFPFFRSICNSLNCRQSPSLLSTFLEQSMYPKVKVREVEDDEEVYDRPSFQAFDSPSVHVLPPVEEDKSDLTPIIVRVPVSDISSSDMTILPPPKEAEKLTKRKDGDEGNKANIKPNSFLRPRAVLSSPDNDGMIGTKNKTKTEVHSGLKSHNSCHKRHVQCKVVPRPIVFGSPLSELKEASHVKHSCPRRKKHLQHTQYPGI